MRHAPTFHEELLWKRLRNRRLDHLKFRRQVPLSRFVADFVCLRHRLVVEADGPFHDPEKDAVRDAWLKSDGFQVLRFPNSMVSNRPNEVVATILQAVAFRPQTSSTHRQSGMRSKPERPSRQPTWKPNNRSAADPVIDPSSGASRHLLPQGEKGAPRRNLIQSQ